MAKPGKYKTIEDLEITIDDYFENKMEYFRLTDITGLEDPVRKTFENSRGAPKSTPATSINQVTHKVKNKGNKGKGMTEIAAQINFLKQPFENMKNQKGAYNSNKKSKGKGKGGSTTKYTQDKPSGKGKKGKGKGSKDPIPKCFVCQKTNHRWTECRNFDPNMKCENCGGKGHPKLACSNKSFSRNR